MLGLSGKQIAGVVVVNVALSGIILLITWLVRPSAPALPAPPAGGK